MKRTAYAGSNAASTCGPRAISQRAQHAPARRTRRTITGPNTAPTPRRAVRWIANSATRMTTAIGTMNGCSAGRDHAEAFDGAEHRDRRRDHAVAVEHRRAEDAEADQPPAHLRAVLEAARHERRQREDAALAAVVGAHDQRDVLQRDDDDERPEDHRQHAEHVVGRERQAIRAGERRAQRVERARADVAVHDADRADDQRHHAAARTDRSLRRGHVRGFRAVSWPRCRRCGAKSGC